MAQFCAAYAFTTSLGRKGRGDSKLRGIMRHPRVSFLDFVKLNRDLRLIALANFLWSAGSMLYYFLWPLYIRDLGGTSREIGLLASLTFLTITLTLAPGGALAQRFERKWLILATWIMGIPAPLIFAFAHHWTQLIPGVIIVSFYLGWPALESYIAEAASGQRISRAYTLTGASFSLGAIFAPLVGFVLLPLIEVKGLFIIAFVLYCCSSVAISFISPQRPSHNDVTAENRSKMIWSQLTDLLTDHKFVLQLVAFSLVLFGISVARPYIPTLLSDRYGLTRPFVLLSSSLIAFGEVVLAILLGYVGDHWGKRDALSVSYLAILFGLGLLLLPWGGVIIPLAMFFLGGAQVSSSLSRSVIGYGSRLIAPGWAFALYWIGAGISQTGGPYLGGVLYDKFVLIPFILATFVVVVAIPFIWKVTDESE